MNPLCRFRIQCVVQSNKSTVISGRTMAETNRFIVSQTTTNPVVASMKFSASIYDNFAPVNEVIELELQVEEPDEVPVLTLECEDEGANTDIQPLPDASIMAKQSRLNACGSEPVDKKHITVTDIHLVNLWSTIGTMRNLASDEDIARLLLSTFFGGSGKPTKSSFCCVHCRSALKPLWLCFNCLGLSPQQSTVTSTPTPLPGRTVNTVVNDAVPTTPTVINIPNPSVTSTPNPTGSDTLSAVTTPTSSEIPVPKHISPSTRLALLKRTAASRLKPTVTAEASKPKASSILTGVSKTIITSVSRSTIATSKHTPSATVTGVLIPTGLDVPKPSLSVSTEVQTPTVNPPVSGMPILIAPFVVAAASNSAVAFGSTTRIISKRPSLPTKKKRKRAAIGEANQCIDCKESFSSGFEFRQHRLHCTARKKIICKDCNKKFLSSHSFSEHRRAFHSGKPKFVCSICNLVCVRRRQFTDHQLRHMGIKPYLCDTCGKSFITDRELKEHQVAHGGEKQIKQYVCKECGKAFPLSTRLNSHMVTHAQVKPHICDICGMGFGWAANMRSHQERHKNPAYRAYKSPCLRDHRLSNK